MTGSLSRATLGIIAGNVAARAPNGVYAHMPTARVYRELAKYPQRAILGATLLRERTAIMSDHLEWPSEDIVQLPPMASTIRAQVHSVQAARAVREVARRSDVVFVRMPFQLPWVILGINKPMVLHFASDVLETVRVSNDYRGITRVAAMAYARLGEACFRRLVRRPNVRSVTNGSRLLARYRATEKGRAVVSSCILASEIPPLNVRPIQHELKVLFVGYFRPEKGIDVLLDAFEVFARERPARLTLVGGLDRASGVGARVAERIESSPVRDRISMLGHVQFGAELFSLYGQHDVLVVPSLSEGTPRTLIEARACSCQVIASDVGGIPDSVRHEWDGLLVPVEDRAALVEALIRSAAELPLRQAMIRNGWERAQRTTVEAFVAEIVEEIELVLRAA